jgi:hypothetical protein
MLRAPDSDHNAKPHPDGLTHLGIPPLAEVSTGERDSASVLRIAIRLMRACYDEANRLANHCSDGAARWAMGNLYAAANDAKQGLWSSVESAGLAHTDSVFCSQTRPEAVAEPVEAQGREGLLPCPFCGGKADKSIGTKREAGNEVSWHYVECLACAAMAEPEIWNRRVTVDESGHETNRA